MQILPTWLSATLSQTKSVTPVFLRVYKGNGVVEPLTDAVKSIYCECYQYKWNGYNKVKKTDMKQ